MMETIQDVLQLILQADDIKYVKNSGILNYGLDFALNGAETAVDFTQALNLYLLSIGYIDEDNLEEYRQKVSRLS